MSDKFTLTPQPSFLRAIQNQKWTVPGAISELVDNSLGSGRGNADHVWIYHDTTNRTITVIDDGQGMDSVGRMFQLGNTVGRSPGDIGIYGSGGTMAIIWLPHTVKVYTLRDGMVSSYRIRWEDQFNAEQFFEPTVEWAPATAANTPKELLSLGHGTMVFCHLLNGRSFIPSNAIRDLGRTYAFAIRNGKSIVWHTVTKGKIREERPITDPVPASALQQPVRFHLVVTINGEDLPINGYVGIIDDLPGTDNRISVGYGHRTIFRTQDCFQYPNQKHLVDSAVTRSYVGRGVTGWLELGEGWQPHLTTTKDGLVNQDLHDALMDHVFLKIEPLLKEKEEEHLRLLVDDFRINLQQMLDSSITVPGRHLVEEVIRQGEGRDLPPDNPPRERPADEGAERDTRTPMAAALEVELMNDAQMERALVAVHFRAETLHVWVNKDHEYCIDALKAKPASRSALSYMITREAARTISSHDGIMRKLFRASDLRLIAANEDEAVRERFIARMLMDRVRTRANGAENAA